MLLNRCTAGLHLLHPAAALKCSACADCMMALKQAMIHRRARFGAKTLAALAD